MASRKPQTINLSKPQFYYHSPADDDAFMNADALHSIGPAIGLPMHQDKQLFEWIQQHGMAPDILFRQGLAAPPIPGNESGLRHYVAEMDVDPQRIVNLDLPLEAQTADVRNALAKMGIRTGDSILGEPLPMSRVLWENALAQTPEMLPGGPYFRDADPLAREDFAKGIVDGGVGGDAEIARNVAANTLYQQLDAAGLPMGVTQGTGYTAGAAYAPAIPGRGEQKVQEARVFQPSKLDIIRKLAVPGAILAGSAAATANAGEMTPPPAGDDQPPVGGFDGRMTPERLASFRESNPQEYRRFTQAFDTAMQQPVVRLNSGATITPDEYLTRLAERAGLSELSVINARNRMAGLDYDPTDEGADELRLMLLENLRTKAPGRNNPRGFSAGADPRQQFALKDRYALTPEGEQGYQSERVYNLLTTFEDGDLTPPYARTDSFLLSAAGAPFAGLFHAAAGDMEGAADTFKLFANDTATPAGRAAQSLYWWDRGIPDGTSGDALTGAKYPSLSTTTLEGVSNKLSNTDNYIPYAMQQLFEGRVYNPDLAMREFGLDVSSPQAWGAAPPMTGPTPSLPLPPRGENYGKENALIQDLRNKLYRTTPQYPAGADPAEMQQLTRDLRDFDMMNRGFANAEYPVALKSMGMAPRFMTPAEEAIANAPRDMADFTLFAGAPFKAAKGMTALSKAASHADLARTAVRQAGAGGAYLANEIKDELPVNFAMQMSNQRGDAAKPFGEEAYDFAFKPMEQSIVTMPDGTPARPDDRYYESHWLPDAYKRRENMLQSLMDRGTNLYKPAVTSPSRASLLSGRGQ